MQAALEHDNELATQGPSPWTIAQLHLSLPTAHGDADVGMISKPLIVLVPSFLSLPASKKKRDHENTTLQDKSSLSVNIAKTKAMKTVTELHKMQ
jgi:hypothetical protein